MTELRALRQTQSLCPVCLRLLEASIVEQGQEVFLVKTCPEHGEFQTLIWRGSPDYQTWARPKIPSAPLTPLTQTGLGCPFDCGLCPGHRQHTCTALLEITQRCNLGCPVCFASAGGEGGEGRGVGDPGLEKIEFWYRRVLEASGPVNIQLSGGEPTLRDDLERILALGARLGFTFLQLNTNGLRLAAQPDLARRLAASGLSSVFLQFDGLDDQINRRIRGRGLFREKMLALEHCLAAGLGVVLVPTLVGGVNDHHLGQILELALAHAPGVRGVHFQPQSYMGRYHALPENFLRLTIPDILRALEQQSGGVLRPEHFAPPGCENARCSFHGQFVVMENGSLLPLTRQSAACCAPPQLASLGASRARAQVASQWSGPLLPMAPPPPQDHPAVLRGFQGAPDLDSFLNRAKSHVFTISGMAFQDAWNLDLERLRDCCIHTVSEAGLLVPFCAYNLTAQDGTTLYRGRH